MSEFAGPRSLRSRLLDAVLTVGSDLDLPSMLERIVQAAVDLVDARYGALGVLDDTGGRLSQFITVGVDAETRAAIGHLPEGHGILGLLIVDAKPLRLPDLREHPDSYGFPPHHPPMRSFLGVPILVRDDVFGNLYLTDKTSAGVFTDVDEELVVGLAAAAGMAIENARLHARVQPGRRVADRRRRRARAAGHRRRRRAAGTRPAQGPRARQHGGARGRPRRLLRRPPGGCQRHRRRVVCAGGVTGPGSRAAQPLGRRRRSASRAA
jgi:GAF domain-containing protein